MNSDRPNLPDHPITVAALWLRFEVLCVPAGAHQIQRREMRRAFYAGVQGALDALAEASAQVSIEAGAQRINVLHDECQLFAAAIAAGRA